MQERLIAVGDDIELSVLEAGAGGRPLLLVHGFTGAKEDFADHVAHFVDLGWWVVAPDLRGHGSSSKPEAEDAYAFEIFAADIVALIEALGWERLVLLGHSMGGMIAQFVASSHAHRLDGLVLMDTAHGGVGGVADPDVTSKMVAIVRAHGMAKLKELMDAMEGEPLSTPAHLRVLETRQGYREFGARKMLGTSPAMYASMLPRFSTTEDRLEGLRGLDVPALVIVGDQDRPFLKPSARMTEALPQGRQVTIPDAGHSPQFENAEAWRTAMTEFLATL